MFMMVAAMYFYVEKFGAPGEDKIEEKKTSSEISGKPKKKEGEGIMEGFYLIYKYDYVKGIFFISSLFMMQVRINKSIVYDIVVCVMSADSMIDLFDMWLVFRSII